MNWLKSKFLVSVWVHQELSNVIAFLNLLLFEIKTDSLDFFLVCRRHGLDYTVTVSGCSSVRPSIPDISVSLVSDSPASQDQRGASTSDIDSSLTAVPVMVDSMRKLSSMSASSSLQSDTCDFQPPNVVVWSVDDFAWFYESKSVCVW